MQVLIAGGSGFLGRQLVQSLHADGNKVFVLTRGTRAPAGAQPLAWDAKTTKGWGHLVDEMDVVIHLTGKSLASWPWTASMKQTFHDSRVFPGLALVEAIQKAKHRPRVFVQQSGINYYGLYGDLADEATPPGDDFPAQLAVRWEAATKSVEALGVRRIITRTAVVLGRREGLLSLMALPVQLFVGGPIGDGRQAMPWIHIKDWVGAVRYLVVKENASGAYNLIAPQPTSNAEFNRTLAKVLHRPYWFPVPAFLFRMVLGEMSVMIAAGRFSQPKRLIEAGYQFQYPAAREAFVDLYEK